MLRNAGFATTLKVPYYQFDHAKSRDAKEEFEGFQYVSVWCIGLKLNDYFLSRLPAIDEAFLERHASRWPHWVKGYVEGSFHVVLRIRVGGTEEIPNGLQFIAMVERLPASMRVGHRWQARSAQPLDKGIGGCTNEIETTVFVPDVQFVHKSKRFIGG